MSYVSKSAEAMERRGEAAEEYRRLLERRPFESVEAMERSEVDHWDLAPPSKPFKANVAAVRSYLVCAEKLMLATGCRVSIWAGAARLAAVELSGGKPRWFLYDAPYEPSSPLRRVSRRAVFDVAFGAYDVRVFGGEAVARSAPLSVQLGRF
jgi:hypothetical protein